MAWETVRAKITGDVAYETSLKLEENVKYYQKKIKILINAAE